MTIYGIGGVSGTGKTHFRTKTCNALRNARSADIAEVYDRSTAAGQANLNWRVALERFKSIVRALLEADRTGDIVLEAFFKVGGEQRRMVEDLAREFRVDVKWGWASGSRAECQSRVESASNTDLEERKNARLEFIRCADIRYFREREGESLRALAEHIEKHTKTPHTRTEGAVKGCRAGEDPGSAKERRRTLPKI